MLDNYFECYTSPFPRIESRLFRRKRVPQNTTVVGGQPATFGPEAKFDSAKLDKCPNDLFKLNGIFAGDRSGGYFLGSHNSQLFEVDFDTTSKDGTEISRIGQRGRTEHISAVGIAPRGGWTVHIASGFAASPRTPDVSVSAVEIHELGNKLAEKFIGNRALFPKAKSNWLRRFDSDAGMALEECVFGGGVSTNTGHVTTNK